MSGAAAPAWTRLGARQLDVLALAGLDRAEIAQRLDISADQVRARLSELQRGGFWSPEAGEPRFALGIHPYAELFPMIGADDLDALAQDIAAQGLAQKIVLTGPADAPLVLDGRNRLAALRMMGAPAGDVPLSFLARHCTWFDGSDPLAFVLSRNLTRRHLTESQRAMVAARLADMGVGRPKGSARTSAPLPVSGAREQGGASGAGLPETKPANLPVSGVTQAEAAERLSISERAVRAARVVISKGGAQLAGAVTRGEIAVSAAETLARNVPDIAAMSDAEIKRRAAELRAGEQAFKARRRAEKEQALAARIAQGNAALEAAAAGAKRYGVIYADPEWRFDVYSRETGMDRAADNHYPTSTTEAIAARPVARLAAKDCVLFLWATAPMLPDARAVMKAWGFEYKSHLIWDKQAIGTGYWFRNAHELLLVGVRGDIPAPAMGTQAASILRAARGAHSAKPDAAAGMIEAYFPTLPKIELNARRARPGWDVWGAEAPDNTEPRTKQEARTCG